MNYPIGRYQELLSKEASIFITASGAGSGIQDALWAVPGISKVFVGAQFPYATKDIDGVLGYSPAKYCSERTAISFAIESYRRAFRNGTPNPIGIGVTASVASNTEHRGDHQIWAARISEAGIVTRCVTLPKHSGTGARANDGEACNVIGLNMILEALGIRPFPEEFKYEWEGRYNGEEQTRQNLKIRPYFDEFGRRGRQPDNFVMYPGAFNPPHAGHFEMPKIASLMFDFDGPIVFMIETEARHKAHLSALEMIKRVEMIQQNHQPVLLTFGKPLYVDKASAYLGNPILMGVDAFERMLDPKWGIKPETLAALFCNFGTKFYVADRYVDGKRTRVNLAIAPQQLRTRVQRVPYAKDISSTEIRAKR